MKTRQTIDGSGRSALREVFVSLISAVAGATLGAGTVLIVLLPSCCAPEVVSLGSPHERWDHNRKGRYRNWVYETRVNDSQDPDGRERQTLALERVVRTEAYNPRGHERVRSLPRTELLGPDGLPAAHLVAVFTGVPVPFASDAGSDDDQLSDREDLVDYLGQATGAQVGIEPKDTAGSLPEDTESAYGLILKLLSSKDALSSRDAVLAWAESHDTEVSFRIVDGRYSAAAFADRVALRYRDFWFVLFSLRETDGYSRLVVVPRELEVQRFDEKAPTGGSR